MTLFRLLSLVLLLALNTLAMAQRIPNPSAPTNKTHNGRSIIQFTGLVVTGEQAVGVPGVNVSIPSANRGTITSQLGYFSIPVLAGDTAYISAIGFKRQTHVIPDNENGSHSVIVYLQADTLQLPTVDITPFPTEELFKRAFLAVNLDNRDVRNARQNLDPYSMQELSAQMGASNKENYNSFMQQQIIKNEQAKMAPQLQLLNPFAWAQFINSIKRGDLKRKKDKQDYKDK